MTFAQQLGSTNDLTFAFHTRMDKKTVLEDLDKWIDRGNRGPYYVGISEDGKPLPDETDRNGRPLNFNRKGLIDKIQAAYLRERKIIFTACSAGF